MGDWLKTTKNTKDLGNRHHADTVVHLTPTTRAEAHAESDTSATGQGLLGVAVDPVRPTQEAVGTATEARFGQNARPQHHQLVMTPIPSKT